MKKQNEPAYVTKTLKWCNERRAEKNQEPLKELPKGFRGDVQSCPCGKATKLSVGLHFWSDETSWKSGRLPEQVTKFVDAFDAGKLSQYEAK